MFDEIKEFYEKVNHRVKECGSGDITPCRQSRSHYQGLTERGALLDRYLLMQRVVY